MKAESVEEVINAGSIESTFSVHPSVFNILSTPVSDQAFDDIFVSDNSRCTADTVY
jgi:hypothetical protein